MNSWTIKSKFRRILLKNRLVQCDVKAKKNKVNLNAWINPNLPEQNVGDLLSKIIVEETVKHLGISLNKTVNETKHLYALGSILLGYQDATVWGSGFGLDTTAKWYFKVNSFLHRHYHKTDIRAVRGPETRRILLEMGIECPEIYGDPGVLMPLFYKPASHTKEKKPFVIIPHYSKTSKYNMYDNVLDTLTNNYKEFIDEIYSSELVISSSLHGIILAEAYGIPAIMLSDTPFNDITKYKDWYYSTGRYEFSIANSVEEAREMTPKLCNPNIIIEMQERLMNTFPKDLWD